MTIENLGGLTLRINGPKAESYAYTDFSLFNIPYDGAVSLHFITKINFDLSVELLDNKSPYAIIIHNTGEDLSTRNVDSVDVTVSEDGYYEVVTLVLPTTTYVEDGLGYTTGSPVMDNLNTNIIAAEVHEDGTVCFKTLTHTQDEESGYYNHIWTGWKDISLNDILVLIEGAEETGNLNEITVKKYTQSAFVLDNLYKCYISKANDLLNIYSGDSGLCSGNSLCRDSLNKYKSEIQIRDYLWMAINVIKYCVQNCQYLKALKVLNCVSTCAGICSGIKVNSNIKLQRGCGCSK